jgi:hypothetical protein
MNRFNWIVFSFLVLAKNLMAQDYNTAYQNYIRGDYLETETSLTQALETTQAPSEKAKIYKLMGIAQYMQGKRALAATSFKYAKAFEQNLQIQSSEVADPSIIDFFNSIPTPQASPKAATAEQTPKQQPKIEEPKLQEQTVQNMQNMQEKQPTSTTQTANSTDNKQNPSNVPLNKAKKKTRKARSQASKKPVPMQRSFVQKIMPFGIGHFMEKRYLMGSLWAGGQIGGIALFYMKHSAGSTKVDVTNAEVKTREAEIENFTDQQERLDYHDDTIDIANKGQAEADSLYNTATIGIGIAVASYVGSIIDMMLTSPPLEEVSNSPVKKTAYLCSTSSCLENQVLRPLKTDWKLVLEPTPIPQEKTPKSLTWNLGVAFDF